MRRVDNLTVFMRDCLKFWKPRILKPSGSVQTCTGIALPIPTLDSDFINQQQYYNCTVCAIIPCNRTLIEMLTVAELVKEFPSFFIT